MVTREQIRPVLAPFPPRVALVLGSGLSAIADRVRVIQSWPFDELPGLVISSVAGHRGQPLYGVWAETPVLLFAGRIHYYEGHGWNAVTAPICLAADLGIQTLVLTNAAGGIRPGFRPGTLMCLFHHIKWTQPRWWARGIQKSDPIWYSYQLNDLLLESAFKAGIPLEQGIYGCLTGPSYETPAEIRALRTMGVDAVGMSTAIEAEEAYRQGMETVAISCITNVAAGLSDLPPTHEEVLAESKTAAQRVGDLLDGFLNLIRA